MIALPDKAREAIGMACGFSSPTTMTALTEDVSLVTRGWTFTCVADANRWLVIAEKGPVTISEAADRISEAFSRAEQEARFRETQNLAALSAQN